MILVWLNSGSIDLELINGKLYLQFNCYCREAIPFCHAMCCRNRPSVNVLVGEEEAANYRTTEVGPYRVLEWIDKSCIYLDSNDRCAVHTRKPSECRKWHCSPKGVGNHIEVREKGWLLSSDDFKFKTEQ